jgi:hypothetical protein
VFSYSPVILPPFSGKGKLVDRQHEKKYGEKNLKMNMLSMGLPGFSPDSTGNSPAAEKREPVYLFSIG